MPATQRRLPLFAGNWKMHRTLAESRALAEVIVSQLDGHSGESNAARGAGKGEFRVGLFPSAVSLAAVAAVAERLGSDHDGPNHDGADSIPTVLVGAQNMHFEEEGAFTGEISAAMIRSAGGNAVILGHSERRHIFGETNQIVGKKVAAALDSGLIPILCVGETLEERDAEKTLEVVGSQLADGIGDVGDPTALSRLRGHLIVAYEPVWAIGTGRTASPEQAQEVHEFIRRELPAEMRQETLILYGGSVKPENAADLLEQPDIDGALVGGASLKPESFVAICEAGRRCIEATTGAATGGGGRPEPARAKMQTKK